MSRPLPVLSRPFARAVVLGVVALLTATACSSPEGSGRAGSGQPAPEPTVYVAVGASETVGVGADVPAVEAWPRVLHDSSLPESRLVNVGVSGSTVSGALEAQVPRALAAEPDVVTVWLAVNDVVARVPVAEYERRLGELVGALRADGATVLVGNVPPLWRLPIYRACLPGVTDAGPCTLPYVPTEESVRALVRAYNDAIDRVVETTGATLVDLSAERSLTRLVSEDGFHPSTAGHREIAEAFAQRLAT